MSDTNSKPMNYSERRNSILYKLYCDIDPTVVFTGQKAYHVASTQLDSLFLDLVMEIVGEDEPVEEVEKAWAKL